MLALVLLVLVVFVCIFINVEFYECHICLLLAGILHYGQFVVYRYVPFALYVSGYHGDVGNIYDIIAVDISSCKTFSAK